MGASERHQTAVTKGRVLGIPTTPIVVALMIPLVVYFGFSAGQKALEVYRLNQQAAQIKAETEALKSENARLRKRLDYLSSDAFVEKVAREELNLVRPGDKAVVVLAAENQKESGGSTDSATAKADNTPNWLRWWNFFFGE